MGLTYKLNDDLHERSLTNYKKSIKVAEKIGKELPKPVGMLEGREEGGGGVRL